jgi:hypothetical protein
LDQQPVAITNDNTPPADDLNAFVDDAAITGDAIASGSFTGLAPGDTDSSSIMAGVSTANAGVKSGTATIDFQSVSTASGSAGQTTTLDPQTINIGGTVDNYATASLLASIEGLQNVGDGFYILNLGTATQGDPALTRPLPLSNIAPSAAPADDLSALFPVTPTVAYSGSSFNTGLSIGAGGTEEAATIRLSTAQAGTFTQVIDIVPESVNASEGTLLLPDQDIIVVVDGTILPSSSTVNSSPPPDLPTPISATAWGDVHFIDFDGLTYNFQAEGEFILAKATTQGDDFQVQIRLQPYFNGAAVTVMTQVAAAVGQSRVTLAQ